MPAVLHPSLALHGHALSNRPKYERTETSHAPDHLRSSERHDPSRDDPPAATNQLDEACLSMVDGSCPQPGRPDNLTN